MIIKTKYFTGDVDLVVGQYSNGRLALQMFCSHTKELALTPTVNIPEVFLKENEILIKNWSENEGILDSLVEQGLVEDTGKVVPTGYVIANIVKITDKLSKFLN